WALPRHHQPGVARRAAVGETLEFAGLAEAAFAQLPAKQRQRVRAEGQPGAGVVGTGVLPCARWRDRDVLLLLCGAREQRQLLLRAGAQPARAVAVPGEAAQRGGLGQLRQATAVEAGTVQEVVEVAERRLRARRGDAV